MINVFFSRFPVSYPEASHPFGTGAGTEHAESPPFPHTHTHTPSALPRAFPYREAAERTASDPHRHPDPGLKRNRCRRESRAGDTRGPQPPRKRPHGSRGAPQDRAGRPGSPPPPAPAGGAIVPLRPRRPGPPLQRSSPRAGALLPSPRPFRTPPPPPGPPQGGAAAPLTACARRR